MSFGNHSVPPLVEISMDNSSYFLGYNAPISYRTREQIAAKLMGKQDETLLHELDIDVTSYDIIKISSEEQECFCNRIEKRFCKTYMKGDLHTFFYAVSYHIFGVMKMEFAKRLFDMVAQKCDAWKMFDIIAGTAALLQTDILAFLPPDCNKNEFIKRISPYIVNSPDFYKYPGNIYIFHNSAQNCFEAVIGLHGNAISYNMYNSSGCMNITFRDNTRTAISFEKVNVASQDNVFKYLASYTTEYYVDMDAADYQRAEQFFEDNTSYRPCIQRDGNLYNFANYLRFESLKTCIFDAFMEETNCNNLVLFLNDCDRVPRNMLDHTLNQLQTLDLHEIQHLPPSKFNGLQMRIEQMNDFLCFISEMSIRASDEPVALLRFSNDRTEVFLDDWYTIPVNVQLQRIYPTLVLNKTRFVLCGRFLVFIDKHSLAYIDIFNVNDNVHYSQISPGGPKSSELQLCTSNKGSLYMFHPESLRYAYIDNEMNVWPWSKLENMNGYELYDLENSPFTIVTVYPRCDQTTFDNIYLEVDGLEDAMEQYRQENTERLALRRTAKQHFISFISGGIIVFDVSQTYHKRNTIIDADTDVVFHQIPVACNESELVFDVDSSESLLSYFETTSDEYPFAYTTIPTETLRKYIATFTQA